MRWWWCSVCCLVLETMTDPVSVLFSYPGLHWHGGRRSDITAKLLKCTHGSDQKRWHSCCITPWTQQVFKGSLAGSQISGYNPIFYRCQKSSKWGLQDLILFGHVTSFLKTCCQESKIDFWPGGFLCKWSVKAQ